MTAGSHSFLVRRICRGISNRCIRDLGDPPASVLLRETGAGTHNPAPVQPSDLFRLYPRTFSMKLIVAVIRPHKIQEVKDALSTVGVTGLTVTDVRGVGKQKGQIERYRGSEYKVDLIQKCKLEVAVTDDQTEEVLQTIRKAALTGEIGDGKIFVLPLEDSMRIRTAERGEDSL